MMKFHSLSKGLLCWISGNETTQSPANAKLLFACQSHLLALFRDFFFSLERLQGSCSYGLVVAPFPSLDASHQIFNS